MERRAQNKSRSIGAAIGMILGAVVFDGLLIFVPGPWSGGIMEVVALFGTVGMGAALGTILGGVLGRR